MNRYPEIDDRRRDREIEPFPWTEPATQIHASRAGHDDRVKGPPGRLLHQRHDRHEDNGSDGGTEVIRDEKRRKDS